MDFLELKDLKLPHCIKCKCGKIAAYLGDDRAKSMVNEVALCEECYKNIEREIKDE